MSIEPKRLPVYATAVSDLFFNTDLADAVVKDRNGDFDHYDEDILRREAESFLTSVRMLNGALRITPDELIADFYARI